MQKPKRTYPKVRIGFAGVLLKVKSLRQVRRGMEVWVDESRKRQLFVKFKVAAVEKRRGVYLKGRGWWSELCTLWVFEPA